MTKDQKYYYSAVTDKNKKYIVSLLSRIYPDKYFPALNDDAVDYITQFQKSVGLYVDGMAGKNTVAAMEKRVGISKPKPVVIVNNDEPVKPSPVSQPQPVEKPKQVKQPQPWEIRLQNFVNENGTLLLILGIFGLWAKKR